MTYFVIKYMFIQIYCQVSNICSISIFHVLRPAYRPRKDKLEPSVVCAVVSASGKKVIYPTELSAVGRSRGFKKAKYDEAEKVLSTWISSGSVPSSAMQFMQTHFPKVVHSVPFFKQQAAQQAAQIQLALGSAASTSNSNSNSQPQPPMPVVSNLASPPTSDSATVFPPPDLCDVDSDMWEDLPDEDTTHGNMSLEDQLGPDLVRLLYSTNRRKANVVPFARILTHWFVTCKIPQEHITMFLKLLKTFRPTLCHADIDRLPTSARTLLKVSPEELGQVQVTEVRDGAAKYLGTYMHYGVEAGVLGTSPGMFI